MILILLRLKCMNIWVAGYPKESFPNSSSNVQIITLQLCQVTAIGHVPTYVSHCLHLFLQELVSGAGWIQQEEWHKKWEKKGLEK